MSSIEPRWAACNTVKLISSTRFPSCADLVCNGEDEVVRKGLKISKRVVICPAEALNAVNAQSVPEFLLFWLRQR